MDDRRPSPDPDPLSRAVTEVIEAAGTVVTRLLCRLLGHDNGHGVLPFCIWCGTDLDDPPQTP